ncbi:TerC family protein [Buchnera aphidicola (Kurisakia onigurumii)]|uniref:TerC family protein n=1 Tax=Buchnera aphidicola TaxID=9 RepID=UPI0031B72CAE
MIVLLEPSVWAGLFALVVLEIILGLDNLLFITILVSKLHPIKRDKARILGLILAFFMRIGLLSIMSWITTLTYPIINNQYFSLSGRNLILLIGGLFLLFKATIELHDRLENSRKVVLKNKTYSKVWVIVLQIIFLDAIFSLDSIVTAIGIVNQLFMMIIAIFISMIIMFFSSKALTKFITLHKTVVVLCLSFLLIVGLSLVSESLGFCIPKGYLYGALIFSVFIEFFNQISRMNFIKHQSKIPIRQRAAKVISRIIKGNQQKYQLEIKKSNNPYLLPQKNNEFDFFKDEERFMLQGVLTLSGRSIRSIMTPRREISWINVEDTNNRIRKKLLSSPHSLFPVCKGELDEIIGIVRAKELLVSIDNKENLLVFAKKNIPIVIPETLDPINLLNVLRKSKGNFVIVNNEFGVVQGLITPLDVLEAIAGEFPDSDETPDIIMEKNGSWLVKGGTDLHSLERVLDTHSLINNKKNYASLSGLLISQQGKLPQSGEIIKIFPFCFYIVSSTDYHIDLVRITKCSL